MMRLASIHPSVLAIPFKSAFRHASAERSQMQSIWVDVRATNGSAGIGEGCPRVYVTGETIASAMAFCERYRTEWMARIVDLDSLADWIHHHEADIDANPAAWAAVELACLDCIGRSALMPIEALLGVPALTGPYRYSAVIGDGTADVFGAQLRAYVDQGFGDFKIKLSGDLDRDAAKVRILTEARIMPSSVRADANNLFPTADAAIAHLSALGFAFGAIEEPLRANDHAGLRKLGGALGVPLILDESALRVDQLDRLAETPSQWIVNVRVSKMGGLLRSAAFVRRACAVGVRIVVGAHVGETSVLTRAGLAIAELAGDRLVAQEGAFGTHLLARDPAVPCLMFGAGGELRVDNLSSLGPGLGLSRAH